MKQLNAFDEKKSARFSADVVVVEVLHWREREKKKKENDGREKQWSKKMKEKKKATTHLLFFFYPKRPDKYRVGKTPQKTRVAADIETPYKRIKQMEGEWLLCDTCLSITAHEINSVLFLFFFFFVVLSTQYENTQRQKKKKCNQRWKKKKRNWHTLFSFP